MPKVANYCLDCCYKTKVLYHLRVMPNYSYIIINEVYCNVVRELICLEFFCTEELKEFGSRSRFLNKD